MESFAQRKTQSIHTDERQTHRHHWIHTPRKHFEGEELRCLGVEYGLIWIHIFTHTILEEMEGCPYLVQGNKVPTSLCSFAGYCKTRLHSHSIVLRSIFESSFVGNCSWTIRTHPLLMVNIWLLRDVGQNVVSFIFQYKFCGAGNTSLKTQSMKKCSVKSWLTKQFNLTHSFLALGLTLV